MAFTLLENQIRAVRDKTTEDEEWLDTDAIKRFIVDNTDTESAVYDFFGCLADCFQFMARDEAYLHKTEGDMTYDQPTCLIWFSFYSSKSPNKGGVEITVGTVSRGDNLKQLAPRQEHVL